MSKYKSLRKNDFDYTLSKNGKEKIQKFSLPEYPLQPENLTLKNLKLDISKEYLEYKIKKAHKQGNRTPKELWRRIKYLSKGLTLTEWSDRVELSWERMLEYTEKVWENFFIYSFKGLPIYPIVNKFWADSYYAQLWRNWRREEDTVTWQTNSRIPWHKHIRLSNDSVFLYPKKPLSPTLPETALKTVGYNRLTLNKQSFTNYDRHERLKQGSYNTEKFTEFNNWYDSANMYLKYIRPWLMRLNYLDKNISQFKYLGKEMHQKNYKTYPTKHIFQKELYQVNYILKLFKEITALNLPLDKLEKKFGKRNLKLYLLNIEKQKELLKYEKLLYQRQTNVNLNPITTLSGYKKPENWKFTSYNNIKKQNLASKWLFTYSMDI